MHRPGITLKREALLAIVVLDGPERMNACNQQMFDQMAAIAQELEKPPLHRSVFQKSGWG
jgi:enoyl-CoA hydratase/carnithine racemase